MDHGTAVSPTSFSTHPSRYKHWKLAVDDANGVATLTMHVDAEYPHRPGYELKLNSYDLSVDVELADAIMRLRFEHPTVRALVITADLDRVFCSGANIYMLGLSSHSFKVNFCKYTNETRLYLEDASQHSGLATIAACRGTTAGGGYELALACDEILLVDDGNSAVSFPETPLLAVLPGTGGLTRLVDKRKVPRDRADVFCTLAEGFKGKRAKDWGFVDALVPRSKWNEAVRARAAEVAKRVMPTGFVAGPAIALPDLELEVKGDTLTYRYVTVAIQRAARTATLMVRGPETAAVDPASADTWSLRAFRELDDALLRLRFNEPDVGLVLLRTEGVPAHVIAHDEAMANAGTGLAREIRLLQRRVLRRLDNTARSLFAVADAPASCFVGSLLEMALAADRFYMLSDADEKIAVRTSVANHGFFTTWTGLSRLQTRYFGNPSGLGQALDEPGAIPSETAAKLGLATIAADEIDFADELRIAVEERASLSPDALTGMEASLRFVGPETLATKIFGRLSAWQNWIFTRANATGEQGALTLYGRPERAVFTWTRT